MELLSVSYSYQPILNQLNIYHQIDGQVQSQGNYGHIIYKFALEHFEVNLCMSRDLPKTAEKTVLPPKSYELMK